MPVPRLEPAAFVAQSADRGNAARATPGLETDERKEA
jgi:hypothetical protein